MNQAGPLDADGQVRDLRRIEVVLGNLLRYGVVLSVVLLTGGVIVSLLRHPDYLTDPGDLARLTRPGAAFPHTLRDVGAELAQVRGRAIMTVGLLLLIGTPVARVVASIVAFALERDWRFVALTTFVLVVLLVSFWIGKVE
jgi:uncharacterized membrane protein